MVELWSPKPPVEVRIFLLLPFYYDGAGLNCLSPSPNLLLIFPLPQYYRVKE